jgi:hypothetical protein
MRILFLWWRMRIGFIIIFLSWYMHAALSVAMFVPYYGRGTGPGTAAHWEPQPSVVAHGAAAALRTRPLPQPTASSLVVESFFFVPYCSASWMAALSALVIVLVGPSPLGLMYSSVPCAC